MRTKIPPQHYSCQVVVSKYSNAMMEKSTGHLIWNLFHKRMVSNIFPTDHTHSVIFNRNAIHIAVMCRILAIIYIILNIIWRDIRIIQIINQNIFGEHLHFYKCKLKLNKCAMTLMRTSTKRKRKTVVIR